MEEGSSMMAIKTQLQELTGKKMAYNTWRASLGQTLEFQIHNTAINILEMEGRFHRQHRSGSVTLGYAL